MERFFSFIFCIVCFPILTSAQQRLEKTCDNFWKTYTQIISTKSENTESLNEIASDTVIQYVQAYVAVLNCLDYEVRYPDYSMGKTQRIKDEGICYLDFPEIEDTNRFWINLKQIEGKWQVYGVKDEPFTGQDVQRMYAIRDSLMLLDQEKEEVFKVTEAFFSALDDLRTSGNLENLKAYATEENYWYNIYKFRLDSMKYGLSFNRMLYSEIERDYVQFDSDSVAECRIVAKKWGGSRVFLEKEKGGWKVAGENGDRVEWHHAEERKQRIEEIYNKCDLRKLVMYFKNGIAVVLKTDNLNSIKEITTPEFAQFFHLIKLKAGNYNREFIRLRNEDQIDFCKSSNLYGYYVNGDTGKYVGYAGTFYFIKDKESNKWVISGLNGYFGSELDLILAEESYLRFLRSGNFIYSEYEIEVFEGIEEIDFSLDFGYPESVEKVDTTIYDWYDGIDRTSEFNGGTEKLYEYIRANRKIPPSNRDTTYILVEFLVEVDGSLSEVNVLNSTNPSYIEEVHRLISKMPKWTPATKNEKVIRSRHRIIIPF